MTIELSDLTELIPIDFMSHQSIDSTDRLLIRFLGLLGEIFIGNTDRSNYLSFKSSLIISFLSLSFCIQP